MLLPLQRDPMATDDCVLCGRESLRFQSRVGRRAEEFALVVWASRSEWSESFFHQRNLENLEIGTSPYF